MIETKPFSKSTVYLLYSENTRHKYKKKKKKQKKNTSLIPSSTNFVFHDIKVITHFILWFYVYQMDIRPTSYTYHDEQTLLRSCRYSQMGLSRRW